MKYKNKIQSINKRKQNLCNMNSKYLETIIKNERNFYETIENEYMNIINTNTENIKYIIKNNKNEKKQIKKNKSRIMKIQKLISKYNTTNTKSTINDDNNSIKKNIIYSMKYGDQLYSDLEYYIRENKELVYN